MPQTYNLFINKLYSLYNIFNCLYKSGHFLNNGHIIQSLFTTAVIVERTIDNFVIFLNAENFTDVRQSNVGDVLTDGSPQFTEVWAPLDGYFSNAGLKIKCNSTQFTYL